jgi:hypothetical protein
MGDDTSWDQRLGARFGVARDRFKIIPGLVNMLEPFGSVALPTIAIPSFVSNQTPS